MNVKSSNSHNLGNFRAADLLALLRVATESGALVLEQLISPRIPARSYKRVSD